MHSLRFPSFRVGAKRRLDRGRRRSKSRVRSGASALVVVIIALSNVTFAGSAGATPTTIFGQSMTPGIAATLSLAITLNGPGAVAFDTNGDLFIANLEDNTITVLPASSGTLFGQSVTAGVATQLSAATGLNEPAGLAFDANGDLFVSSLEGNTVFVVPVSSGTIFGQSVSANQATTLNVGGTVDGPTGLALDANGDLFIADGGSDAVTVDPASSGTLFGQSVTADVATQLSAVAGLDLPFGLAVDAHGDLVVASIENNSIMVLPASSGTIFGQSVTADVASPLAVAASGLDGPDAVAFDANGDLFIANAEGSPISVLPASSGILFGQAVTPNVVTSVTAATAASLGSPLGIAFDASGDLYVSNFESNAVIELASTSVLTANQPSILSAASGLDNPYNIVIDAEGDLFISNTSNNTISVLPTSTGTIFGQSVTANQIATLSAAAGLNSPTALAFDASGDLFISNDGNNTISVVPASTGTIFGQSVTENQVVTLSAALGHVAPFGMAFDANGDLFGSSIDANLVTVLPASAGTIFGQSVSANHETTVSAATGLSGPDALAFDTNGDLFISNNDTSTVTVLPALTGTIFGQSVTANLAAPLAAATGLTGPQGFAFDANGDLFITNANANSVSVLPASTGTLFGQSVTANQASTLAAATGLGTPLGIAFDTSGDLYITNDGANSVTILLPNAATIFGQSVVTTTLATTIAALDGPIAMTFDTGGDLLVSNYSSNSVVVDPASSGLLFGQSVTQNDGAQLAAAAGLDGPTGIALDAHGDLFIVNNLDNTVTVVPASNGTLFGQSVTADVATPLAAATGLDSPVAIAVGANGDLFISNLGSDTVTVVPATSGTIFAQSVTADVATHLAAATGLVEPSGMALDTSGDLYISNVGSDTVSVVPASTGTLFGQSVTADVATHLAAVSGLLEPSGMALDASGDLYISNVGSDTVSVVPASSGTLFGQSVSANQASTLSAATGLDVPEAPAIDSNGDLFITNLDTNTVTVVPALSGAGPGPGPGAPGTTPPPAPGHSTISLLLRGGGPVRRGVPLSLTASISAPGNVTFADNGETIKGCGDVASTTTSATCRWTPSRIGVNALVATLTPTESNDGASTSSIEIVSVIGVPGAPRIKRVRGDLARVTLLATRVATTGGSPILSYQYALNGVWHPTKLSSQHEITIPGLHPGHSYRVRLRARNRVGFGPPSNLVSVTLH